MRSIVEYMFSHSFWGLCAWDLPAFFILVMMILVFVIHRDHMKKREEELEDELERQQLEETRNIG